MTDDWNETVASWVDQTNVIPKLVREHIQKSKMEPEEAARGMRSLMEDPLQVQYAMGFKDRKYSLTYDVLKRMPHQVSIIAAIFQTRINQVAAFSVPYRSSKSVGFVIKHKDPEHLTSKSEVEFIKDLETFIYNCGHPEPNPYNNVKRDGFETFLKKIVRDSLSFDQACALAGSWVELADGTGCFIESLRRGMKVRTHTGQIKEIIKTTKRSYSGELVTIQVGAQRLTVTVGHPVYAANRISLKGNTVELDEPKWVPAGQLTNNMYVVYPKHKYGSEYASFDVFAEKPRKFPVGPLLSLVQETGYHPKTIHQILTGVYRKNGPAKKEVLEKAKELGVSYQYKRVIELSTKMDASWGAIIGLYLAEGNCSGSGVRFTFHEEEESLLDIVRSFGDKYGISSTMVDYEERKAKTIVLNSKALSNFLIRECGTGSGSKRIPSFIFDSPRDVCLELLKYYLLGDGHIKPSSVVFGSISRNLFTGVRLLLSAEGIYCTENIADDAYENHNVAYKGHIGGSQYRNMARLFDFPCPVENDKKRLSINEKSHIYKKIQKIYKYKDKVTVYNCEVEDDHSYVMQGFLNHNCVEIIPDRRGIPYEFVAVDASTIRIAATDTPFGPNQSWKGRSQNYSGRLLADMQTKPGRHPYNSLKLYEGTKFNKTADYVQILNSQIENVYTRDEMIFGVRNPRTDIYIQGYGYGELEQLVTTITAVLYAEEYNRRFFSQGSSPKGILNFKGDSMTPSMLEGFKRQWRANLEGVENSWRTPILQSEQGVDWIDLNPTNKDMEYGSWVEYLLKLSCGVFLLDPAEINFDLKGGVQQTPLFESSQEWKLKASRDKGLKPLLRFIAKLINESIINKIDDHFVFDFAGLEELTEQEKHTLRTEQVASYLTLNEIRVQDDLEKLPHGDIPMNPTYLQAMQQAAAEEQQKEQMAQQKAQFEAQQSATEAMQGAGAEDAANGIGEVEDGVEKPQYSDSFGKSLALVHEGKYLEVDLSELDDWKASI